MRTVNFRDDILYPIASYLGIDYAAPDFRIEGVRNWIPLINTRTEEAWESLDLPELRETEERAFRTIWNATAEFLRTNTNGEPDSFLYLPSLQYFQVKATAPTDPPAGTLPTDSDYFELITIAAPYIALDQRGRHAIGEVLGVYPENPLYQTGGASRGLPFRLSERGVEINNTGRGTVWLHYKVRPSKFSAEQWDGEKVYSKGARVFDPETGDCFKALHDNDGILPAERDTWALMPVPATLATYIALAAASDAADDLPLAQKLYAQAQAVLVHKYDSLGAQNGLKRYRLFPKRYRSTNGWCDSLLLFPPFLGGVTTLTDVWLPDDGTNDPDIWVTESGSAVVTENNETVLV